MKNILLCLSLLYSLAAFGQDNKFKFGVLINPNLSGNFLSNDGSVPSVVSNLFDDLEDQTLGYYGYLFTQYPINSRFKIQAGIGYSNSGYAGKKKKVEFGQSEPGQPEYARFFYKHHDIMLPVLLRYNISRRPNKFYLIGGVTPQIKISRITTAKLWYPSGEITTSKSDDNGTGFRKVNANGTIGIGYDMKLSGKLNLFVQPTFDCNLLGTSRSASLNRRIYTIGLNLGLIFA